MTQPATTPAGVANLPSPIVGASLASFSPDRSKDQAADDKQTGTKDEIYIATKSDNDWTIAHHAGITVKELHRLNPDVDWRKVHPGQKIHVPGSHQDLSAKSSTAAPAKSGSSDDSPARGKAYKVSGSENDWSIAKKFNVTVRLIHELNPDVDWRRLHPGEMVRVPSGRVTVNHAASTPGYVATATDNVILHRGPSTSADRVTEVPLGTVAAVVKHDGDWYQLRFPKGTVAWVRSDMLVPARHHSEPSSRSTSSSHRQNENSGKSARYARASRHGFVGGREAYSASPPAAGKAGKVLKTAYAMRGTRYVWGGTSRSGGFDCSGFTSTVFDKDGIHLPRTSIEQSQVGKRVSRSELKKGDLVFFKTMGSHRINHVGIYIGNGKFMHASSGKGRVTVSSLSDSYYSSHFAEARRVIKPKKSSKSKK